MLFADLFIDVKQIFFNLVNRERKLYQIIQPTYRFTDDVLSLKNPEFGENVNAILPREPDIKDTSDSLSSASYLYSYLNSDAQKKRLHLKHTSMITSFLCQISVSMKQHFCFTCIYCICLPS